MKKLFTGLFVAILTFLAFSTANAENFQDLLQQKKPCAVLIYADWADNVNDVQQAFTNAQWDFSNKYNFKKINIADEETKEFNKTNYIYSNLPYIMLYKERGRMSRLVVRDCILNYSCLKDKLSLFAN